MSSEARLQLSRPAQPAAVDEQAAAATGHREDELAERNVGEIAEGDAQPAARRGEAADEVDSELAPEGDGKGREPSPARSQVDRSDQRVVEERGPDLGPAIGRIRGAGAGGEDGARADVADAPAVEQPGGGQGDGEGTNVGVARPRPQDGAKGGVDAAASGT